MQKFKDTLKEKKRLWMIELRYYMRKTDLNKFYLRWMGLAFIIFFGGAIGGMVIFRQSPLPSRYVGFLMMLAPLPAVIPAIAQILTQIGLYGHSDRIKGPGPVLSGWLGVIFASFFFFIGLYLLITGKAL